MRKKRHNYSPEEKVIILKRHLVGREPVSDLCDEYKLQPNILYGSYIQVWCLGIALKWQPC